jgi:ParB-like chromosome segregation protein Spo0J
MTAVKLITPESLPHLQVPLHRVHVGANPLRPLDDDEVTRLAISIQRIGLMTPITVRYLPEVPGPDGPDDGYELIAGRHRLAAAKSLGWEEIDAIEIECSDVDAKLWEIAENLHRADLTQLQRKEQIAEWIKLTNEREVSSQVERKPKGGRPEGGVEAAAREIGVERNEAHRSIKVASLSDEAKAAAVKHGLDDNQALLLEAAKEIEPKAQVAKILERAGKSKAGPVQLDADPGDGGEESFLVGADQPGAAMTNKLISKVLALWESIDPTFAAWIETEPDLEAVRALGTVLFAFAKDLDRRGWVGIKKKRRADGKTYADYSKRFGSLSVFVFDPENMRLVQDSLTSGVDHLADEKQAQIEHAEQYDRDQEVFQRTPITSETEQHYTKLITHRGLYEGACSLAWPMYFKYRDEHPDLPSLTPDDLEYAGMWTSCAVDRADALAQAHA